MEKKTADSRSGRGSEACPPSFQIRAESRGEYPRASASDEPGDQGDRGDEITPKEQTGADEHDKVGDAPRMPMDRIAKPPRTQGIREWPQYRCWL